VAVILQLFPLLRRPSGVLSSLKLTILVSAHHLFRERCPLHHPDVVPNLYPKGVHCQSVAANILSAVVSLQCPYAPCLITHPK